MIQYILAPVKAYVPFALVIFGAGETIGEGSPISVGLMVIVIGGVWILSSRLQKLSDGQRDTNHRLVRIETLLGIKKLSEEETTER